MKIALAAKLKLGFIDGKYEKSEESTADFVNWKRADCMVISWILNSMSKELVSGFIYSPTTRELWRELEERFGQSNGPQLYQLQREICSIWQGEASVAAYYTKLKGLWDELECLLPAEECTCSAAKIASVRVSFNHLMQFLMGLNDSYDDIRNQILVMEPLPTVNKACSLVLRVEKQREVHSIYGELENNSALLVRNQGSGREAGKPHFNRPVAKKKEGSRQQDKLEKFCDHCKFTGHTRDTFFKLVGYPDWYKDPKDQRKKSGGRPYANAAVAERIEVNEQ